MMLHVILFDEVPGTALHLPVVGGIMNGVVRNVSRHKAGKEGIVVGGHQQLEHTVEGK